MSPVTACLLALLTVGFLVTEHNASVLQEVEADTMAVEEAERTVTVEKKINELIQEEEDCINTDDVDCLMELFDKDVRMMRTGQNTKYGTAEFVKHYNWVYKYQIKHTVNEVLPTDSDASYVVSRVGFDFLLNNGSLYYEGKSVQVLKKINNGYKVYIDIFNHN